MLDVIEAIRIIAVLLVMFGQASVRLHDPLANAFALNGGPPVEIGAIDIEAF